MRFKNAKAQRRKDHGEGQNASDYQRTLKISLRLCAFAFTYLFLIFVSSSFLLAEDAPNALSKQEKISLALALHDVHQAKLLLEELQQKSPENPKTQELLFEYFIELKDFENIQALYNKLSEEKRDALPSSLFEKIAWVVIKKGADSAHPRIRVEAALAAAGSQEAQGAHILNFLLTDPHQGVQSLAFQLAVSYKDACIQETAEALSKIALVDVKLQAAKLLAEQKASCAKEVLVKLMEDETLSEANLFEVVQLLATLKTANIEWVKQAVINPSSPIRALAAATLIQDPVKEGLLLIIPLLKDPCVKVRELAATCLGLYLGLIPDKEDILTQLTSLLNDSSMSLQATAAWALLLSKSAPHQKQAQEWFKSHLSSAAKEEANIITSRLIRTGKEGLSLAEELLPKISDLPIRLNLSAYLLLHKISSKEAIATVHAAIASQTLFGQQSFGFFSYIGQASSHNPLAPRLPEAEDLYFRLNLLALLHYSGEEITPKDMETILHERTVGLTAATASFLFQEMLPLDEVLHPLLSHEEEMVRVQAALLLAIFSRSKKAALTLQEEYKKASKAGKELLLLGFSLLPASKTRSLVFPLLFDQSQVLRTRAAGVFLCSCYQ
jgi:hypothetical protein